MSSSSQNPTSNSSPLSREHESAIRAVAAADTNDPQTAVYRAQLTAVLAELDRVRAELTALTDAAFAGHKVRLVSPLQQIQDLRDSLTAQMARAETLNRLCKEQRERADRAEALVAETRIATLREAARLLEATDRDDDAVNFLDLLATAEQGAIEAGESR